MDARTWGIVAAAAVAVAWAVLVYNGLVRRRNEIANAFAQIDVQLKRRFDLIPNLVDVARRYLQHERETLEAVARARQQAGAAADRARESPVDGGRIAALAAADAALSGALGRLLAVVEAYPELRADATLRDLSEELGHTENRIAFARQAFNDQVMGYNIELESFPASLVGTLCGFRRANTLRATASAQERHAVPVAL